MDIPANTVTKIKINKRRKCLFYKGLRQLANIGFEPMTSAV